MEKPILGTGDHVYEVIHPFGNLPDGMAFENVSHIATDSKDRVYAFQRTSPPVAIFDGDGNFLGGWGEGVFLDAHGIFVTPEDEIFLIDRDAHEVLKFDTNGNLLMRLGNRNKPALQAPFNHPADIAVAPSGEIFVADGYGNSCIHRFTAEGEHVQTWGERGDGAGQFSTPHGIWVDDSERVYVCDRENNRVQIFTTNGDFLTEWRDFFHPMDIFLDRHSTFYVTDQIPRISMLDAEGQLISRGRTPYNGHGIWVDTKGNIYMAGNEAGITKLARMD